MLKLVKQTVKQRSMFISIQNKLMQACAYARLAF